MRAGATDNRGHPENCTIKIAPQLHFMHSGAPRIAQNCILCMLEPRQLQGIASEWQFMHSGAPEIAQNCIRVVIHACWSPSDSS
jgi:hypothetical protein